MEARLWTVADKAFLKKDSEEMQQQHSDRQTRNYIAQDPHKSFADSVENKPEGKLSKEDVNIKRL